MTTTFRSSFYERHNAITAAAVILNGDPNEAAALDVLEESVKNLNNAKGIGEAFRAIGDGLEKIEALAPKSYKDLPPSSETNLTLPELSKQVHAHFPSLEELANFARWTIETGLVGMPSHPYSENGTVTGIVVYYEPEILTHLALTDAELKLDGDEKQAALKNALRRAEATGTRFITPKAGKLAGKIAVLYTLEQVRDLVGVWCRDPETMERFDGVTVIEVVEISSTGIIRGSILKLGNY